MQNNEKEEVPDGNKLLEDFIFRMTQDISDLRREVHELRLHRQIRNLPKSIIRSIKNRLLQKMPNQTKAKIKTILLWWNKKKQQTQVEDIAQRSTRNNNLKTLHSRKHKSLLIIAHHYPIEGNEYGGNFIAKRVSFYKQANYEVSIFLPSRIKFETETADVFGTRIISAPLSQLEKIATQAQVDQLAIHSPTPEIYAAAKNLTFDIPSHIWIHGFEARNWRDLIFNFSPEDIAQNGKSMDIVNVERQWALSEMFKRSEITKIFVSSFMKNIAEEFAREKATNSHVIHNVIDPSLFPYSSKSKEDRFRICSIRSFERRNYGTDLLSDTILHLEKEPWFKNLSFQIIGDGRFHNQDTKKLKNYGNIEIIKKFVKPEEVSSTFSHSGIALLPSRWESQGVLNGEAMAMGVIPVTNKVAAIPEFISAEDGKLAEPENSLQLAQGIQELVERPDHFLEMSESAYLRITKQCGPESTVDKEINIFEKFYT